MKVVFFGTPTFAAHALQYLLEHDVHVVAVISKPDKPKGRSQKLVPTPVKTVAALHSIPVYQPEKASAPEFAELIHPYEADLFVVVAYGEIIKQHLLDMPKQGCINLHVSLLPKYRGAAPVQHAIINGETETGATIMHLARAMDAGDIIKQVKIPVGPDETFGEVEAKLLEVGSKALLEVIHAFAEGKVTETPQDHSKATLAPKIELEDCEIDWSKPAQEIHNLVRGVNPYPGAWCFVGVKGEKKRLKIKKTTVEQTSGKIGEILECNQTGMAVACGEGTLRILELQLEGKKAMRPDELLRGTQIRFNP